MPKRTNFISVQRSHAVPTVGGLPSSIRTGYEWVMANQVDGTYCHVAKDDGVVIDIKTRKDIKLVSIRYNNGDEVTYDVSTQFVNSKGHTYKHTYVCNYQIGEKFKKGDVIVFCSNFFVEDILNKGKVIYIQSALVTTAIVDFLETLEDGSCISDDGAKAMVMEEVNKRSIIMDSNFDVLNLLTVGSKVESDDILCTLEDPLISKTSSVYNAMASDALKRLASNTPRAKYTGTIDKIEMYYFCDFEELSPSLQKLAKQCDGDLTFVSKGTSKGSATSGRLYEPTRINGEQINRGQVIVVVYISHHVSMSSGDKSVVGNQLKNVVTRRLTGVNETESGLRIDAWFGYQSISNRIVQSPELMGVTNRLLRDLTERAVAAYDS